MSDISRPVGDFYITQRTDLTHIAPTTSYDLILGALSWEQRSSSAFQAMSISLTQVKLLKFASTNADAESRKVNQLANFTTLSSGVEVLGLKEAVDFESNSLAIRSMVQDVVNVTKRPLRILIDITCIPKSYLLYIIGMSFSMNFAARIDCVYAEGSYALDRSHSEVNADVFSQKGIISEGEWTSLRIPFYESDVTFPTSRDVFVAMGGEVGLSVPFIERYEPSRLGIALIAESLVQHPDRLPDGEKIAIQTILAAPNLTRSDVSLTNVLHLIEALSSFRKASVSEVITAVAIGSKPHALALGIAALGQPKIEVVCRIPKRYRPLDVAAAGKFSLYEIEDRFEPLAYLE